MAERMRCGKLLSKAKGEHSDLPKTFMHASKTVHKRAENCEC